MIKVFSIKNFLDNQANESENIILYSSDNSISYNDMLFLVFSFSKWLTSQGVESGDIVCIKLPNSIESLISFWSLLYIDACPFFLNLHQSPEIQKQIINNSYTRFVILSSDKEQSIEFSSFLSSYLSKINISIKALSPQKKIKAPRKFLQFTSGSTGVPKAIVHDQSDMVAAYRTYGKSILSLTSNDLIYSPANYSYAFSFAMSTFQPLFFKSKVLVSDFTNPWQIISFIKKFNPSILCAVPSLYKAFLSIDKKNLEKDFSSINLFLSSGEVLPASLNEKWLASTKKPLIDGVGSSESISAFISNSSQHYLVGSSGKAVAGYDVRILNDKSNGTGRIQITGDSISTLSLKELIENKNNSKTIILLDLFKKDSEGYFWYVGRSNFMFKIRGKWVNPIDIEKLCGTLNFVKSSLLFKDNKTGKLVLLVTTNKAVDKHKLDEIIKSFLREKVDSYKIPDKVITVNEIPLTTNGKINRRGLTIDLFRRSE